MTQSWPLREFSKRKMMASTSLYLFLAFLAAAKASPSAQNCTILVYGTTPAGITAAVAAARHLGGGEVCLLSAGRHVGGMVTGGLGKTDTGGSGGIKLIGGLALEFFTRVGKLYGSSQPEYYFAPSIASRAFHDMLSEANVTVAIAKAVKTVEVTPSGASRRLTEMTAVDGSVYAADVWIDASYEGDLLAAAGLSYTVGREGKSTYNESLAGRQRYSPKNQFYAAVDPWNHTTNTLLPLVYTGDPGTAGQGDNKVSAYNLRLCLTKNTSNMAEITKPENYDPTMWELARRYANSSVVAPSPSLFHFFQMGILPHGKSDVNNAGPMSTDYIGASWKYPDASYEERLEIIKKHYDYTHGFLWFLGHDPELPEQIRTAMLSLGLCKDEFLENEFYLPHWPPQLYVREARRLIGDYVFTQHSAQDSSSTQQGVNSIGCGRYNFDSHNAQRYACIPKSIDCNAVHDNEARLNPCCQTGRHLVQSPLATVVMATAVIDEGDIQVNPGPFQIPYDVLLPKKNESSNLLVPGAVSASHVGFSCLRLEPQWMIMGHSAGTAAAMAAQAHGNVNDLNRAALHTQLVKEGQILDVEKIKV